MTTRTDEFKFEVSKRSLGYNLPQRLGRALWGPMFLMALMSFPVAFVLGAVRANEIADGGGATTIEALRHVSTGVMFLGFASVFAAVSFAIAKILGEFRRGGGEVQEAARGEVQTLRMPVTAKVFIAGMGMAMMAILGAVVAHWVIGGSVASGSISLIDSEQAFVWLEAVRRLGVAMYLTAITFGLGTIITVLRFQSRRIRELADARGGKAAAEVTA